MCVCVWAGMYPRAGGEQRLDLPLVDGGVGQPIRQLLGTQLLATSIQRLTEREADIRTAVVGLCVVASLPVPTGMRRQRRLRLRCCPPPVHAHYSQTTTSNGSQLHAAHAQRNQISGGIACALDGACVRRTDSTGDEVSVRHTAVGLLQAPTQAHECHQLSRLAASVWLTSVASDMTV